METKLQPLHEARALVERGSIKAALAQLAKFREAEPDSVAGFKLCAELYFRLGRRDDAFTCAMRAYDLNLADLVYGLDCAFNLIRDGRRRDALRVAELVSAQDSQDPHLRDALGTVFTYCEQPEQALPHFEFACAALGNDPQLLSNLASVQRMTGAIEAAQENLDHAVRLAPQDGRLHLARAALRRLTPELNHVEEMRTALAQSAGGDNRISLQYALAKELEDLGRYRESFAALSEASREQRMRISYNLEAELAFLKRVGGSDYAPARRHAVCAGRSQNVFVVGLPRSGTTLVDRVISSIPGVVSVGESKALSAAIWRAMRNSPLPKSSIDAPIAAMLSHSGQIAGDYLGSIERWDSACCVVDKTPSNYLYAGFIRAAFPQARIICLRRNAMDSCYAMFKTLFIDGYPFTYDLAELADYYLAWHELISQWEAILGDAWLSVHYEELVRSPEPVMRRVVDHCGLRWDDRCLRFHELGTPVTTASAGQVTRPLYTDSIGMWKNYASELEVLANRLEAGGVAIERG
jgi:tetratricopeptide (TPR) repeat protein